MAGPVVAGDLPPLLPTPTTATSCVSLRPPPASYASKEQTAMAGPVVVGGLPPLLPTPTSCVSLRPSYASRQSEGTTKPAGRASWSVSWIKDKLGGGCVSSDQSQESWSKHRTSGSGESADRREKVPGRASLSSSWVDDKVSARAGTSTSKVERAGRQMGRNSSNEGKRSASRAPSADWSEKKAKAPTDKDDNALESETEQYAGPTFVLSTDPSEISNPFWFASPNPSKLPVPLLPQRELEQCTSAGVHLDRSKDF